MQISVLICSYNKSYHLKAILKNLNNQDFDRTKFEVCLIVDGSNDDTMEMLTKTDVNYEFSYYYIENSGLTKARNYGIDQCKGSHVLFCDDDLILKPKFLTNLSKSINQNPTSVQIGNLINIDIDQTDSILEEINTQNLFNYQSYNSYQTDHIFFDAIKKLYSLQGNSSEFETATWWAVVTGGNLCIPKECFSKAGKFDPNIIGWGPEDADLCFRIFNTGYNAVYNRNCLLFHLDHKRNTQKIAESMTRNAFHFYKKHNKPKALSYYLQFMNGVISMREFNDACCEIFNLNRVDVPEFYMSMKNYTKVVVPTFIK